MGIISKFVFMKKLPWIVSLVICACGGSVSNEQRQEMAQAREKQVIRKVSEAELLEATSEQGRNVVILAEQFQGNSFKLDSLSKSTNIKIKWLTPYADDALEIEKQVIEAYIMSSIEGSTPENTQMIGEDSLLYTKPVTEIRSDGIQEVKGIWSLTFSKKQIILSLEE